MTENIEKTLEILTRKGYQSVAELAEELGVSDMTVRRYLDKLEEKKLITRTFGGAFVGKDMIEVDYRARDAERHAEKKAIGKAAYALIEPGESVFIDAGTTAAHLAAAVDDTKRISVVTNSLIAMGLLERRSNVETLVLGGRIHAPSESLIGPLAEEAVAQFRFGKAFLGANGIDGAGFTQANMDEVPIKKCAAANAREVIVLADSSKFDTHKLVLFLRLEQVSTLITDPGIPPQYKQEFEEKGLRVIIAEPEAQAGE
jgi:DeoR/GlpR family transcriptional regulator of sugar metabolism